MTTDIEKDEDRIKKLPQWARDTISGLRRQVEELKARNEHMQLIVDELQAPIKKHPHVVLEPYLFRGDDRPAIRATGVVVIEADPSNYRSRYEVALRSDSKGLPGVEVRASVGCLWIHQSAGNVIHVVHEDDLPRGLAR